MQIELYMNTHAHINCDALYTIMWAYAERGKRHNQPTGEGDSTQGRGWVLIERAGRQT